MFVHLEKRSLLLHLFPDLQLALCHCEVHASQARFWSRKNGPESSTIIKKLLAGWPGHLRHKTSTIACRIFMNFLKKKPGLPFNSTSTGRRGTEGVAEALSALLRRCFEQPGVLQLLAAASTNSSPMRPCLNQSSTSIAAFKRAILSSHGLDTLGRSVKRPLAIGPSDALKSYAQSLALLFTKPEAATGDPFLWPMPILNTHSSIARNRNTMEHPAKAQVKLGFNFVDLDMVLHANMHQPDPKPRATIVGTMTRMTRHDKVAFHVTPCRSFSVVSRRYCTMPEASLMHHVVYMPTSPTSTKILQKACALDVRPSDAPESRLHVPGQCSAARQSLASHVYGFHYVQRVSHQRSLREPNYLG